MADPTRGGHRRRYVLLLLVLTAFTLATLDSRSHDSGPIGAAGRLAHRIVQPVANAADTVLSPLHDWWSGVVHRSDLVRENRTLRDQLGAERAKTRADADQRIENDYLRKWFDLPVVSRYRTVGARVVSGAPGNFDTTVVLSRGSEAGVRAGMAVVGPEGLIGRVVKAWNGGADVRLVADPSFGVSVRLVRSGQFTTATKRTRDRFEMTFEDQPASRNSGVDARRGDTLITCGCNGSDYPLGIPVATVTRVQRPDRSKVVVDAATLLDGTSLDVVNVILWLPGDPVPSNVVPPATTTSTTTTVPSSRPGSTTTTVTTTTTVGSGG